MHFEPGSDGMHRLISCLGLVVLLGLAALLSSNRRRIPWRTIAMGTLLQFLAALFVLKTATGRALFQGLDRLFQTLFTCVDPGAAMVFGPRYTEFPFAFKVLPAIIFFSALMAVLYHLGIMQFLVRGAAYVMHRAMRVSGAESLSAAANIFMGQTEAPLVIRPYLPTLTTSELNSVMIGGFATISGSLIAVYGSLGVSLAHLLTASVISAPAGLVIAKILEPETGVPATASGVEIMVPPIAANLVDAIATGARDGLLLALNVAAMLIAFLGLIAALDYLLGGAGQLIGNLVDREFHWTLAGGLGYLFAPLAWVMGVEAKDCLPAGQLLGLKTVANEFIAYEVFAGWLKDDSPIRLTERSQVILTYALCGFANFGSIGIQIGGLGTLAPERRTELARLAFRAMWGGAIACCTTACIAGILI